MITRRIQLSKLLRASVSPAAWLRQVQRWKTIRAKSKKWKVLDAAFMECLKLPSAPTGPAVLVEGMWDNPNQYFRLRLFLEALPETDRQCLIAILRTPTDRSRNSLESLGIQRFYCLSDMPITDEDRQQARVQLASVKSHQDLMRLTLPSNIPPKILYDTAIKITQSPRPALTAPIWQDCLADLIRLDRFYSDMFSKEDIRRVVFSHPWKNEYGSAAWKSIQHGIPFYHLNGEYETMRVRIIETLDDFNAPIEMYSRAEFGALPEQTQDNLRAVGNAYLQSRGVQISTDVNEVMAFGNRETPEALLARLNLPTDKPIIVVCFHAWIDFPHAFDMRNFTDFCDWTDVILDIAYKKEDVIWLLKPHPAEPWYGSVFLKDMVNAPPSHVVLLDDNVSSLAAQGIADAVVTVHGTVAMEAGAKSIPVLASDRNFFMDWNFATTAYSRDEFKNYLENIETLPPPNADCSSLAGAFTYLCVAPVEPETGLLRLKSDHLGPDEIFDDLIKLAHQPNVIHEQVDFIREWLNSECKSYSIFHKIKLHSAKAATSLEN